MTRMRELLLVVSLGLGMSTPAWAIAIVGGAHHGTDVGGIDLYLNEVARMSSGEQTETDWVNLVLGLDEESAFKKEDLNKIEDVAWFMTDASNVIAFQLQNGAGYFLVKNSRLHVLFENMFKLDWGVIDLNSISGRINLGDDMEISHVSGFPKAEIPPPPVSVPEPGSLGLLGAGLIILGLFRRRKTLVTGAPAMARVQRAGATFNL